MEQRLTPAGNLRATQRVTVGRLSIAQKRTSWALLRRPICTAVCRMSGSVAMVCPHSARTTSMACME